MAGNFVLLLLMAGCSGESIPRDRVAVSGSVKLGDDYVDQATVVFVPLNPSDGPKTSVTIEKGLFALPEEKGPLEGKHRVEIHPVGIELGEMTALVQEGKTASVFATEIPRKYQQKFNGITVDVVKGAENHFEWVLSQQ
ncbi:MAG: hypothetical protein CMJ46_13375 [Planctomyces sp.]|nr:hypothetical protein [Planctomyces sp.]